MAALRKEFLRKHYLDQVLGSFAFRAKLSAFVVPYGRPVGSPLAGSVGRTRGSVKALENRKISEKFQKKELSTNGALAIIVAQK
jgi:hypothetical protein